MYNKQAIMSRAWEIYRKEAVSFAEALHRAWNAAKAQPVNDQRVADAKAASGIEEDVNTWAGWKRNGFEVIHGEKALFCVELIYASKGDGKIYKGSFFGRSQVAAIA